MMSPWSLATQEHATPTSPNDEYQALLLGWRQALREYAQAEKEAKTPEKRKEVFATFPKPTFQDRFMELARKYPEDPISIEAIAWVFENSCFGPKA